MSASGYTIFNKYTVVDDVITEGYACQTFGIFSEPLCVQGGDASYYNDNKTLLNELNSNSTFTGASGSCVFDSDGLGCYVGDLYLNAFSSGYVAAVDYASGVACHVFSNGNAGCEE